MTFKLEIELGNDAMRSRVHVADALQHVARGLHVAYRTEKEFRNETGRKIFDINGNSVGTWRVEE
jgi:hypothetical protein